MSDLNQLIQRAERMLERLETLMPAVAPPDWSASVAFRWRRRATGLGVQSWLQPVRQLSSIRLADLHHIDEQKTLIERNTRQFVRG
ncbi:MAG: DUF815 domain-containing protein, partial [Betaproteobacteria bacterium]|nr:DUF815 domain-containing protein [Betaproteobacteria bacterium]